MPIQALFITPSFAVARLGGSTTPLHSYDWVDSQRPRSESETDIAPSWTLAVQPDGSVAPFLPTSIAFRDGDLIRPVAPFFEIWARLGASGSRAHGLDRGAADHGAAGGRRPFARLTTPRCHRA